MLRLKKLGLFTLLLTTLVASPLAFADINPTNGNNAWTIYAFANAQVIAGMLEAAKGLINESSFTTLIAFVGMMSVLIAATMTINGKVDPKVVALILGIGVTATVGLKEKSNVIVHDPVFGDSLVVQDVPSIVALPAAFITTMGHNITELLEKHFTTPSGLTLSSGGGFDLSNSLLQSSTKVDVVSPYLKASINKFVDDCLVPSIAAGWVDSGEVITSKDLWGATGTFSHVNPSLFTLLYTKNNTDGVVVPCKEAGIPEGSTGVTVTSGSYPTVSAKGSFEYISKYFNTASTDWFKKQVSSAGAGTWLVNTLNAAQKYVFNDNSYDTTKSLEQAAAINSVRPALMSLAAQSGNSNSSFGYAIAQAEQSQRSSWATTAVLFQDLAAYTYSVLQAFIIGLSPIVLVIMMLPGGLKVAKNYGTILVWLALWEPTLAIVNYVIMLYSQGSLADAAMGGYDMLNVTFIDSRTNNFILAASALAAATPMISWAIVKGGNAFTSFIASGIGTQFANKAGEIAATGNKNYGNTSAHNDTMDQHFLDMETQVGMHTVSSHWSGANTLMNTSKGASAETIGGASLSQTIKASASRQHEQAQKVATEASHAQSVSAEKATTAATTASSKLSKKLSENNQHTTSDGTGTDAATKFATQLQNKFSEAVKNDRQIDTAGAATLGVGASFGVSFAGNGVGIKGDMKVLMTDKDGHTKSMTADEMQSWVNEATGQERANRAELASHLFGALSEATKGVDKSISDGFKQAAIANHQLSQAYKIEQSARNTINDDLSISQSSFQSQAEIKSAETLIEQHKAQLQSHMASLRNMQGVMQQTQNAASAGIGSVGQRVADVANVERAVQHEITSAKNGYGADTNAAANQAAQDTQHTEANMQSANQQTRERAQELQQKTTEKNAHQVNEIHDKQQQQRDDYVDAANKSTPESLKNAGEAFQTYTREGVVKAKETMNKYFGSDEKKDSGPKEPVSPVATSADEQSFNYKQSVEMMANNFQQSNPSLSRDEAVKMAENAISQSIAATNQPQEPVQQTGGVQTSQAGGQPQGHEQSQQSTQPQSEVRHGRGGATNRQDDAQPQQTHNQPQEPVQQTGGVQTSQAGGQPQGHEAESASIAQKTESRGSSFVSQRIGRRNGRNRR